MAVRGMDISNHQSGMDVERVVRENDFKFVFILTNDGTFVNKYFHAQADAAERAGAIVLPYVYLRPNWAQTVDIHLQIVGDRYDSSIVDVEDGSGGWGEVWAAHNRLWDAGQRTPLVYFPNFYWVSVGRPDLSPLAGRVDAHWKSWYADRDPRTFDDALNRVEDYVWNDNRGGIPVAIVQFTGTGRVNGYGGNVDLNYFRGSLDELIELLGGDVRLSADDFNLEIAWTNDDGTVERGILGDLLGKSAVRAWQLRQTTDVLFELATKTLAAVTNGDIDADQIREELKTKAYEGAKVGADQAVKNAVLPALREVLGDVLDDDNADQAEQIVQKLGLKLAGGQKEVA